MAKTHRKFTAEQKAAIVGGTSKAKNPSLRSPRNYRSNRLRSFNGSPWCLDRKNVTKTARGQRNNFHGGCSTQTQQLDIRPEQFLGNWYR